MISYRLIHQDVKQFAVNITSRSNPVIEYVEYKPEPCAKWGERIDNVIKKTENSGVIRYGWLFEKKMIAITKAKEIYLETLSIKNYHGYYGEQIVNFAKRK